MASDKGERNNQIGIDKTRYRQFMRYYPVSRKGYFMPVCTKKAETRNRSMRDRSDNQWLRRMTKPGVTMIQTTLRVYSNKGSFLCHISYTELHILSKTSRRGGGGDRELGVGDGYRFVDFRKLIERCTPNYNNIRSVVIFMDFSFNYNNLFRKH